MSPLLAYAGSYRGGLSNHLPMELRALAELGADEGRLRRLAARHGHLEPLWDDGRDIADSRAWLGDPASEAAWRRRLAWERRQGEWLRHWAGRLQLTLAAPAGASFHGLIRLAYALSHWRLLDLPGRSSAMQTLPDLLADWGAAPILLPPQGGLIEDDIERALALPAVSERLPPGLLGSAREQRRHCRQLFLATHDLDALHLITAWEAALIGVFVYCGYPALAAQPPQARGDAAAIRRLALDLSDPHGVKLALSCLRLAGLEGDAAWLGLAEEVASIGWKAAAPV